MTAAAPSHRARALTSWAWFAAWLVLAVYFVTPPRETVDRSLDRSNYATYSHFITHDLHWGADVIPMTGPLGFVLYGHTYSGELFIARLVMDFVLKAVFAGLLLHLFGKAAPGALRWIWLAAVVLLVPTVDDLFHDFAILVATLVLLVNLPRLTIHSWLAALLLGVLALIKGTHLLTTAACFGSVVLLAGLTRRWRALGILIVLYLGAALGGWVLSGQSLASLPVYLKGVLELSSGYNATMGLPPGPLFGLAGPVLAAGVAAVFAWAAWRSRRSAPVIVALLLLAGFSFIKWKHGYLRADGHVLIFFTAAAVIVPTICLAVFTPLLGPPPPPASPAQRRLGLALAVGVAGLAAIGSASFSLARVGAIIAGGPAMWRNNLRFLTRPTGFRAPFDAELKRIRLDSEVPAFRNEIGGDTVDFFGNEVGVVLLNDLNYRPRPMGGGTFNVFTPWLQERNAAFLRDAARAPAWMISRIQGLDDALPAADDALTLTTMLELYQPVVLQRDYLLFKRRAAPPELPAPQLLGTQRVAAGATITVPDPGPGRMLLFSLEAPLTLAGRVRSFLYQPPALRARIFSHQHPAGRTYALKSTMLQRPVLLSPLVRGSRDLLQLFGDEPGDEVRSLRLDAEPGFKADGLAITFYSLPRPPKPERREVSEILTHWKNPVTNRAPVEVVTQETGIRELNREPVISIHAPGSIAWALEPEDGQLLFTYGLMPHTYQDGGQTDGVEFRADILSPGAAPRTLWRRLLRPLAAEGDRGLQHARILLPAGLPPGSRVQLAVGEGPAANAAWDQTYLMRIQLKRQPAGLARYFGFSAAPLPPGFAPNTEYEYEGHPVRGVHPPLELTFAIPADAKRVIAGIGLMSGAYQDGNKTDGVGFSFAVRRPDGTTQTLGYRLLDPLHRTGDRGVQPLEFKLPPLPPGSVLVFRTDPGPRQDLSWDWAFLQTLVIE